MLAPVDFILTGDWVWIEFLDECLYGLVSERKDDDLYIVAVNGIMCLVGRHQISYELPQQKLV